MSLVTSICSCRLLSICIWRYDSFCLAAIGYLAHRERERERASQRHRQRDKETEIERQRDRNRETETERQRDRGETEIESWSCVPPWTRATHLNPTLNSHLIALIANAELASCPLLPRAGVRVRGRLQWHGARPGRDSERRLRPGHRGVL